MPGLVTRIGLWIDDIWKDKATFQHVLALEHRIDDQERILRAAKNDDHLNKELSDLKTRIEKMELYTGMTRKVDPTKPGVAKSAFSM